MSERKPTVHVCAVRYSDKHRDLLEKWARRVLGKQMPRSISNDERLLAHWAGRAALSWLFTRLSIHAAVQPDPDLGFLRAIDEEGQILPRIFLNVSHTADRAVAVVATRSVGVDIESANRDGSRVYRRVATEKELAELSDLPKRLGLPAIALWSAKEAFSKAVGLGMNFGLQEFEIHFAGEPPFHGETSLRGPLPLVDPALVFDVRDGFVISICGERSELERGVSFHFLEAPELGIP